MTAKRKKIAKYPLEPRALKETAWFYEEPRGITVVQEVRDAEGYRGTAQVLISWRKLRAAVDNHLKVIRK